jgi:hypothetical protein
MRVQISSKNRARRTVPLTANAAPENDNDDPTRTGEIEGAGETKSEETETEPTITDTTTPTDASAMDVQELTTTLETTKTPETDAIVDQPMIDTPQETEITGMVDQNMPETTTTLKTTKTPETDAIVDQPMIDTPQTPEISGMVDQNMPDTPTTLETTTTPETAAILDQGMINTSPTPDKASMVDQNMSDTITTPKITATVDQDIADITKRTKVTELGEKEMADTTGVEEEDDTVSDLKPMAQLIHPPVVAVSEPYKPLSQPMIKPIGPFSSISEAIGPTRTTEDTDHDMVEAVLSTDTLFRTAQPSWIVPDEVPSRIVEAPTDPKGLSSDLAQRCYEVTLMFVAKYPMCKPIGVEFLEYLVRTTTDDKLYEGAVASKNMVCGDWFTALPIGSFKNIMNSRNLLITLGVKGGYKKSNVKLFNETLPIKDRFWVVHNNGRRAGQHFVAGGPDVDKQSHQLIQKLRSKMSFFVSEQFNVFNEAEKASVEKGFINDRDTIFILGLDNGAVYHIVGVVQFVATKHGAFITWLAVLHESPPQVYFNQNKSAIPSFRRLGMASFLQELVQLLLIARGWKPDLYLQSNVKSPSRNYYEHRGYVKAPSNSLSSVPGLSVEAFQSKTINFVTDEIQVEHSIDESERLHLFYHEGPLKSSFLSPTDNSILPAADSDGVIEFPFNCSGNMIDRFTSGDNIFLLSETSFGAVAGVEYAVRDTANSASINQNIR